MGDNDSLQESDAFHRPKVVVAVFVMVEEEMGLSD
jgi:hypothetical protein